MPTILRTLVCIAAVATACATASAGEPAQLPQELLDAGWMKLFDGATLVGWQPVGDAKWEVVQGTIRTTSDKPGFLMTTSEFADFELHVEFQAPAATNSGVFLRTALKPTDPTRDCYELNIAPVDNPFPTGSLVGRKKAILTANKFPAADQWHALDVIVSGGKLMVALDRRSVLEYEDPAPIRRGHVGLQANQGPVAFRNIRIREIRRE
jgi:hypothetical protein